jgi:uncharacterized membrane protein YozB (DUF420 family)
MLARMDPKVAYWTGALLNMGAAVALAAFGVRRIRAGAIAAHRRLMLGAGVLVAGFLVSYVAKVWLLGREALETWDPRFVHVLRFHELCVAFMVLGGGTALYLATTGRFAKLQAPSDPAKRTRRIRIHRAAGWTAVVSSALGVVSAGYVLYGMYARLP